MAEVLAARVRAALAGRDVREVRMFGGLSFMVNGRLAVAVRGEGALLVHVDPGRFEELVARPAAAPATMGERSMGPGWLTVSGELSADELNGWLEVATGTRSG